MHEGAFSLFKYVKLLTHLRIALSCVTCFSITKHCCPDMYTMYSMLFIFPFMRRFLESSNVMVVVWRIDISFRCSGGHCMLPAIWP
jgi:hypothetical protein